MNDKKFGYLLLIGIVSCFIAASVYTFLYVSRPLEYRTFAFPNIGNLKTEDPINVHGVNVGKIKGMSGDKNIVYLNAQLEKPLTVYQNYSLSTVDKGVLGDRIIVLHPGDPSAPLVAPTDTLFGEFILGPSEIVGMAWKLRNFIDSLAIISLKFQEGTKTTPSFITSFHSVVNKTDAITHNVQQFAHDFSPELSRSLHSIDSLIEKAYSLLSTVTQSTPEKVAQVTSIINDLNEFLTKMESFLILTTDIITKLQNQENLLWNNSLRELNTAINELQDALNEIRYKSMQLKILPSLK